MTAAAARARAVALEAVAAVVTVALVAGVAGLLLHGLDAVPALVTGEPRYVRRARTVQEVERRLRTRLVVPFFFPSALVWPPSSIRYTIGPPGAVALYVDDREGAPRLFLAQTVGPGAIPPRILPDAQVLSSSPVAVGPARGTLSRIVQDGNVAWQLTWDQGGRNLLLRARGATVDELLRIARSAREAP